MTLERKQITVSHTKTGRLKCKPVSLPEIVQLKSCLMNPDNVVRDQITPAYIHLTTLRRTLVDQGSVFFVKM